MGWLKKVFKPVQDVFGDAADAVGIGDTLRSFDDHVINPVYHAAEDAVRQSYNFTSGLAGDTWSRLGGGDKGKRMLTPPTWEEWSKPGEAFATEVDQSFGILPPSWRQYAAPVTSALLNFIPGVGPLVSAGFTTLYNAGKMQQNQKGMDWGHVGRDAAKNFGTAALQMGASKLVSGANAAKAQPSSALRSSVPSPAYMDTVSTMPVNTMSAAPVTTGSALKAFNSAATTSNGATPSTVQQAQTPTTLGDTAYKSAVNTGKEMGSQALAQTLAPKEATPLSGFDATGSEYGAGDLTQGYQFGDQLRAFGDTTAMNTPNPTGRRLGPEAVDAMTKSVGYNNYLQRLGARDQALPAGQYEPKPNTPYANRLSQIETGSEKSYEDLLKEVDNYNAYYGIMDANPTMTEEDMQKYLNDPVSIPENMKTYFQGIQPMSLFNTSMIR